MASRRLNSQPPRTIAQLAAPGGQAAIFRNGRPEKYGLYDPANEHDSCGVGFVAHIKGERSRQCVWLAEDWLGAAHGRDLRMGHRKR